MQTPRINRERKTLEAMLRLYCAGQHGRADELCPQCNELFRYALTRLEHCPFAERKPTCAKCKVHCYAPQMREKIRAVMRYSGPRMLWHHPFLAARHIVDGFFGESKT